MKKTVILLLLALSLSLLAGCGSVAVPEKTPVSSAVTASAEAAPATEPAPPAVSSPPPAPAAEPAQTAAPSSAPSAAPAAPEVGVPDTIDVDLTQLSSTMVYSEVYAMMYEPQQYTGKTVKMRGRFTSQEYRGERLFACIVEDATACCAQGLEFEMAEKLSFPEDYPEPGTEITVVGTFDSYQEKIGDSTFVYLVLRNAYFV